MYINSEREIDGEAFCHLSCTEDIATIFPAPKQFILGSKLYKLVQQARSSDDSSINTSELLDDLDETLSRSSKLCASIGTSTSSESSHKCSKPDSNRGAPEPNKQHSDSSSSSADECGPFKLPVFSPDIQKCISNDAFYTPTQNNGSLNNHVLLYVDIDGNVGTRFPTAKRNVWQRSCMNWLLRVLGILEVKKSHLM